jgi:hypothetical protein
MKYRIYRCVLSAVVCLFASAVSAQANVNHQLPAGYDPAAGKIIPDKVFEIGLPLLVLFLLANTIASVVRTKADARLKEKAIEKGISEQALIALFGDDAKLQKLVYLKWFLVLAALGVSIIYIHLLAQFGRMASGYMAVGVISLCLSISFLIYYRIIRNK